jgi:hypothetical protein
VAEVANMAFDYLTEEIQQETPPVKGVFFISVVGDDLLGSSFYAHHSRFMV